MTDPKKKQGTEKTAREPEEQRRTRETERKAERNPLPREESDTRPPREPRGM
ncbi:MAG TPA: hypothetical protein VIG29_02005 [Vicinamibacteria bacterium]|jgi:hypothetical protein